MCYADVDMKDTIEISSTVSDVPMCSALVRTDTLATGAFCKVYLCLDRTGKPAACKVLLNTNRGTCELGREKALLASLNHPNVVKLHNSQPGGLYEMYMEWGGTDLLTIPFEVRKEQQLTWVPQILSAVQYLHSMSVAHLDLKLENIVVRRHRESQDHRFGSCCVRGSSGSDGGHLLRNSGVRCPGGSCRDQVLRTLGRRVVAWHHVVRLWHQQISIQQSAPRRTRISTTLPKCPGVVACLAYWETNSNWAHYTSPSMRSSRWTLRNERLWARPPLHSTRSNRKFYTGSVAPWCISLNATYPVSPQMECASCEHPRENLWAYPCGHFYFECCVNQLKRVTQRCPACHDPCCVMEVVLVCKPAFFSRRE